MKLRTSGEDICGIYLGKNHRLPRTETYINLKMNFLLFLFSYFQLNFIQLLAVVKYFLYCPFTTPMNIIGDHIELPMLHVY